MYTSAYGGIESNYVFCHSFSEGIILTDINMTWFICSDITFPQFFLLQQPGSHNMPTLIKVIAILSWANVRMELLFMKIERTVGRICIDVEKNNSTDFRHVKIEMSIRHLICTDLEPHLISSWPFSNFKHWYDNQLHVGITW